MKLNDWKNFLYQNMKGENKENMIIKIVSGGSQGGNCWGGETEYFQLSSQSIQRDLMQTIQSYMKILKLPINDKDIDDFFTKESIYGSYDTESLSDGDYYGNYTEYYIYKINLLNLLNFLDNKKLLVEKKENYIKKYEEVIYFKNSGLITNKNNTKKKAK